MIRTEYTSDDFRDMAILQEWLYRYPEHEIEVENEASGPVTVTMDEDGDTWIRHGGDEEIRNLPVACWAGCVEQLKERPSEACWGLSRWDEIRMQIAANHALQKQAGKRR